MDALISALKLDRTRSAWSRAQTLGSSLIKLQGEVTECIEACEAGDQAAVRDELGDVLWSLLFALIVSDDETGVGLADVALAALAKLHHRKSWIFESETTLSLEEEAARWLAVKRRADPAT